MSVVVTGLGAFCSLGENAQDLWAAVERGASGISAIDRFDVAAFDVQLGAMVRSPRDYGDESERLLAFGRAAAVEALEHAEVFDRRRVALVLGTCNGVWGREIHSVTTDIAKAVDLRGMSLTIATACASSTVAIGFGAALIRQRVADVVLAGGVDTLSRDVFAGFHSLGLLSKTPCAPFSTQIGTTLGEGAAFLVLESAQNARRRGVKPWAVLMGYGLSADAYHDTSPDPSGLGMARAVAAALEDAGSLPEDIDYLNAHGTATAANDAAEWRAIQRVFGEHADRLPVSSSKSFLGHAQGAAGALEAVVTLLAMNRDMVPPTTNFTQPRPNSPRDPVAGSVPRPHPTRHVVCVNAAFGGANAALVFRRTAATHSRLAVNGRHAGGRRPSASSPSRRKVPRRIGIASSGIVQDESQVSKYVPRRELRATDTSARLLAGAVGAALCDARIRPRGPACEGIGLFAAQTKLFHDSVDAFDKSVRERGLTNLSAPAFTRMVVNYATGATCRLFGLKGPTATLASPAGSGLTGLVLSADHLAWRKDADYLLAAAVDEEAGAAAGAAAVLLKAEGDPAPIALTGWALAADSETAIDQTLIRAGRDREEVVVLVEPETAGGLGAVIAAVDALQQGQPGPYLVCNCGAAVILEVGITSCVVS